MSRPPHARSLLKLDCEPVRILLEAARINQALTGHVREALSAPENQHIVCVIASKTGAVVWTDSAVWASRLRFQSSALLEVIRSRPGLGEVPNVAIRVQPAVAIQAPARRPLRISGAAAEALWSCAEHVGDEKLREALRRIAARAESG